jgi:hypothetical protein
MAHKFQPAFLRNLREDMLSSSLYSPYRWAEKRVWLPGESAEAGGGWYSRVGYPWVEPILNSRAPHNIIQKGAQLGLSVVVMVRSLYELVVRQRNVMYVLPTRQSVEEFSKTRYKPLMQGEYLSSVIEDAVGVKICGDASLYLHGAINDINLKSTPASVMILDEVTEIPDRSIWLAIERMAGAKEATFFALSTPKLPGQGISALFKDTTQEHFIFPCPSCGRRIELLWPQSFVIVGEHIADPRCKESFLICYECKATLPHQTKAEWLAPGRFEITNKAADVEMRGFTVNQMYSPVTTPGRIAVKHFRGLTHEDARQEFHNSVLAEGFAEVGSRILDGDIDRCLKRYSYTEAPRFKGSVETITLGIDQGTLWHHWVAIWWKIVMGEMGDVIDRSRGKVVGLGKVPGGSWGELPSIVRNYQACSVVIDGEPHRDRAATFSRHFPNCVSRCYYTKGATTRDIRPSEDEYGAGVVTVDRPTWLSITMSSVIENTLELPADIPIEFRDHLKAPCRVYNLNKVGNRVLDIDSGEQADHYFHALTYGTIALRTAPYLPSVRVHQSLTSIYG